MRGALRRLVARSGEPVVRQAVTAAMRILGRQFVMGRTIEEALDRAREPERHGYRYSYDMLGEAARTAADAARYSRAYDARDRARSAGPRRAADVDRGAGHLGQAVGAASALRDGAARARARASCRRGCWRSRAAPRQAGIGFTIDAEEADRLELSLDLDRGVWRSPRSSPAGTGSASRSRPIRSARCR